MTKIQKLLLVGATVSSLSTLILFVAGLIEKDKSISNAINPYTFLFGMITLVHLIIFVTTLDGKDN